MIKIGPRGDAPALLQSSEVEDAVAELGQRVSNGERIRSHDFNSNYWLHDDVRGPLWDIHHRKCCFCERQRDMKRESDIEHYRPKSLIEGADDHPGYWWLAYDWTNLLFSCKTCNQTYKKNFFPLLESSPRAYRPQDVPLERPVLINPIDDDPELCISYDWWTGGGIYVKAHGIDDDDRGTETIRILGLNRLAEARAENLGVLRTLAKAMIVAQDTENIQKKNECAKEIRNQTSSNREYSGFKRAYFRANDLEEFVAND